MKIPALSWWLIAYGLFLFLMGLLGYLSNPEKAATALKSGGLFGGLSLLWALGWATGRRWALGGALATLVLVTLAFIWRSTVAWLAFVGGDADKLVAACLISAMLVASLIVLPRVLRTLRATRPVRALA
jgi:hypothetical protein